MLLLLLIDISFLINWSTFYLLAYECRWLIIGYITYNCCYLKHVGHSSVQNQSHAVKSITINQ